MSIIQFMHIISVHFWTNQKEYCFSPPPPPPIYRVAPSSMPLQVLAVQTMNPGLCEV